MGQFTIRVKPEIITERVNTAQARDIDRLSQQFQLDKTQLNGDGVDIHEAPNLPYDAFMQLSGNDTKITKADLFKFAKTITENDVIKEYAQKIADSLPAKVMDTASTPDGQEIVSSLEIRMAKRGSDIVIKAERTTLNTPVQPKTDPLASAVFSVIAGRDINADGVVAVGGELQGSVFVKTAGDAIKIAGNDMVVTPSEALKAILDKAGKLAPTDVVIEYTPGS